MKFCAGIGLGGLIGTSIWFTYLFYWALFHDYSLIIDINRYNEALD